MTDNPLVSVKMLTYNHAPYIAQAIEGVLSQETSFPFELVIGEDCSTDGTREIVLNYADRCPEIVRLVTSDANVGARANSRRTTAALRGQYIAWCEGDDFWHRTDKLQKQADYLESNPDCGLVHSDHDRLFETHGFTVKAFFRSTGNVPPANLNVFRGWGRYNILTCTAMARLNLVRRISEDPGFQPGADYVGPGDIPLFAELSMAARVHYIDESLATYRVLSESASHIPDMEKRTVFNRSGTRFLLCLAERHRLESEIEKLKTDYADVTLSYALWNRDLQMAKEVRTDKLRTLKKLMTYAAICYPTIGSVLRGYLTIRERRKSWLRCRRLVSIVKRQENTAGDTPSSGRACHHERRSKETR